MDDQLPTNNRLASLSCSIGPVVSVFIVLIDLAEFALAGGVGYPIGKGDLGWAYRSVGHYLMSGGLLVAVPLGLLAGQWLNRDRRAGRVFRAVNGGLGVLLAGLILAHVGGWGA